LERHIAHLFRYRRHFERRGNPYTTTRRQGEKDQGEKGLDSITKQTNQWTEAVLFMVKYGGGDKNHVGFIDYVQ
jgi:hypothetical protein